MVSLLFVAWLATGGQTSPAAPHSDYRVGPQDVLMITVFGEDQLSRLSTVDGDGTIDVALIGRLKVSGMTLRDIEKLIAGKLRDGYLNSPQVGVDIREYRSQNIFVTGEVRDPGVKSLKGNMTLMAALAQAGTLASAGNEVVVVRPKSGIVAAAPMSPTDEGATVTRIDLRDVQIGKIADVELKDGDTVFVPKAEKVVVTGYVRNPGSVVLERGMTVLQAIALAGGYSDRGSSRGLRIRRMVDGSLRDVEVKEIDLMLPGDTIIVKQRLF